MEFADLAHELRFTLTDIRGECCEASYEAVAKALRIVSELAKVNTLGPKHVPGDVSLYRAYENCRAIAAE